MPTAVHMHVAEGRVRAPRGGRHPTGRSPECTPSPLRCAPLGCHRPGLTCAVRTPSTKEMASITLDLPEPFGPMMVVNALQFGCKRRSNWQRSACTAQYNAATRADLTAVVKEASS